MAGAIALGHPLGASGARILATLVHELGKQGGRLRAGHDVHRSGPGGGGGRRTGMSRSGPLDGIRVIEFGNLVAAPYCGMLLADLGAEVIKVEPLGGDLARAIGPFINGQSTFFMSVNRGKASVAADTKKPGRGRCLAPARAGGRCARPQSAARSDGADGTRPRRVDGRVAALVFAAISAFGITGPSSRRAGIDLMFQGESGMMAISGGEGEPPHKTATTIADFVAGTNAATGHLRGSGRPILRGPRPPGGGFPA